jgi:hypothetical protein
MKRRHELSWAQRVGTKRPYWRERALAAEEQLGLIVQYAADHGAVEHRDLAAARELLEKRR